MADSASNFRRAGKRLLVVDDDPSIRSLLVRVLSGQGYEVQAAADGGEARVLSASARFDLVLLDLGLPGERGWKVFARLTAEPPGPPVVIITAEPGQAAAAKAAGARAFFEKPLDFPVLLETIDRLIAESSELRPAPLAGGEGAPFGAGRGL